MRRLVVVVVLCVSLAGCAQAMYRQQVAPPSYWTAFTPQNGQTAKDREWDAGQCYNAADEAKPMPPEVKAQARKEAGWMAAGAVIGPVYSPTASANVAAMTRAWAGVWRDAFAECMTAKGYQRPEAAR